MEGLFSRLSIANLANQVFEHIINRVDALTHSSFSGSTVENIATSIFEAHRLHTPVLMEGEIFQKQPKDTTIPFRNGRSVPGTRFEIVLPYNGDGNLLLVRPTRFNVNIPMASMHTNGLHFIYDVPNGSSKEQIYEDFKLQVANLKVWLDNLDSDLRELNQKLDEQTLSIVGQRKRKLDDDKGAAASSGIPIR